MLTKKEKELVDSYKVTLEKPDPFPAKERYRVFMSLTMGELLALKHGMTAYGEFSPVGADVGAYIRNACETAGIKDW